MKRQSKDISRIVWPEQGLADGKMWQRNIGVVIMLCNMGKVVGWTKNDSYAKFPNSYMIDGVKVKFLPNCGFYEVGPLSLSIPSCAKDVLDAVKVVKEILTAAAKLGPKATKTVEEILANRTKLGRFGLGQFSKQ